ncbi:hypothetical protein M378DRAFT_18375 [Amanita muscaria Koide BX008]|uniref:Uncharacterized protein n=1 Tax=Amanita muscaria (strain Koide BX008) TaxID=946122 RepID=A0A0C2RXC6_AMAMK|nr:hypothetical protein M378DRAFT_18375 [Amanita muscaria Koide BX008]
MSPAVRGDSEYVPDSQQHDSRVQGNSKSLSQQSNRFTPLVGLRDTASLVDFDHDNYYQDLGTIPSGSWLYSTEKVLVDLTNLVGYVHEERKLGRTTFKGQRSKNIHLSNTIIKKLDDVLKEISKLSPEPVSEAQRRVKAATCVLLEDDMDFTSDAGSEAGDYREQSEVNVKEEEISVESQEDFNDRASMPKLPLNRIPPMFPHGLLTKAFRYRTGFYAVTIKDTPSFPSLDIPLPLARPPLEHTQSEQSPLPHTQSLTELEQLRQKAEQQKELDQLKQKAEQQRVECFAFLEINPAKEKSMNEESVRKQLELDKAREQEHVAESPVEGTPDFQSNQLRTIQVQGPFFCSNFGDLNDTVNAPTLRVIKVRDDYFFAPLNTDHDDYFNWVAHQSLVLLQESPRNHFSLHLFLLFIKGLIDEAGPLLPNITIEVKQGKPEAPRAVKPITFVDLSQDEKGFINTDQLYPRTMDQPRIDDTNIVDVQNETELAKEGAKDIEMDANILDEHRRKRDELLSTECKWFEMPPAVTKDGDTLPARPATQRNNRNKDSLPPYIPLAQGAPEFLGRYGPPPAVNKSTRPTTPSSINLSNIANMVNQKFPNASMSERVSLTKSFAEATASGKKSGSTRFPIIEDSSPKRNNTPANGSSNDKKTKDWNGWQQVKKKDFKPTNKGMNPCELHLRVVSGSFGSLDGLYGKELTDAIGFKCRCIVNDSSEIPFNFEWARFTDRKDLIITLDRPLTKESTILLRKAVAYVDDSSEENDVAYLNRATTSSFKFFGVPTVYPDGSRVDTSVFLDDFR